MYVEEFGKKGFFDGSIVLSSIVGVWQEELAIGFE